MDNVPLLVSLFTDCTPATTIEMLKIIRIGQKVFEVCRVQNDGAGYSYQAEWRFWHIMDGLQLDFIEKLDIEATEKTDGK